MDNKQYELALILGRFQVFHKGHVEIVDKALEVADKVLILVGSSQESGTERNPFSYETRRDMIAKCFADNIDRIIIIGIPDAGLGNNQSWGDYVVEYVKRHVGRLPDVAISGEETRRTSWYANYDIDEIFIPKTTDVSATKMRAWMVENNQKEWLKYVHPALGEDFEHLRELVVASIGKTDTDSI